jgi:glycosyltransferase involved in cell wall biosynthesis
LESARRCIHYPNLEWIIVDNMSIEPGLRDYLESLSWIDRLVYKKQTHAEAMNQIVEMATGEYLVIWPEDVQFVIEGNWMADVVELLNKNPDIGSVCLDYMRTVTIDELLRPNWLKNWRLIKKEIMSFGFSFRRRREIYSSRGLKAFTFGWQKPGICGSGIPSITPIQIWRELGPWKTTVSVGTQSVDSSLGAEEDMVYRFFNDKMPLQGAALWMPVAADIITDPLGCKAKVRGNYRYGVYVPPPEPPYYYEIISENVNQQNLSSDPTNFTEGVKPLGFTIPVDGRGDRSKHQFNPSIIFDIVNDAEVQNPLRLVESDGFVRSPRIAS